MTKLQHDGVELFYEESGSGPAIVLSHGFSATSAMWATQRRALESRYRCITWDMRGHGASASPADPHEYSAATTVSDLRQLLDHLEISKAVIGGLSLGGYMSLAFHLAFPDRVSALVICDAGPGYRNAEARRRWNENAERWARDFEQKGLAALSERSREMQDGMRRHRSARGLALAARGMLAQRDSSVIDHLPRIDVPTLVIVGDRDEPFLTPSRYMVEKIPGARLEVIADAGHAANLDQPERFNRALLAFLDSL
jgi:2-succinyl-6-hydroxy-2,4-cyclohexadiene-1-carboxylate synthase